MRVNLHGVLVKAAAGSAVVKVASAGIRLVTAIILAKMLGAAGYGIYSYVMALAAAVAIPAQLGIPGLATREMSVTNARQDWSHMRGFIAWSHTAIAAFSIAPLAFGALLLYAFSDRFEPVKLQTMWLGLLLVPLMALTALRGGMLRGLRKVVLGQIAEQIVRPLVFVAILLSLTILSTRSISAAGVMLAQIVATVIAFGLGVYWFLRHRPREVPTAAPILQSRLWFKSSIPFALSAAMYMINGQTDIIALGIFRTDTEVGQYRIAVQLAELVIFGLQVVNMVQGPHIAHLHAKGDTAGLQRMVTRSARATFIIALVATAVIIVLGPFIIKMAFGDEYGATYGPLVILCLGQLVNASMGSVGWLLNMTGHERDTMQSVAVGAVTNLILNFTLTPIWGMYGAAIATAITLVVWNLLMWRKVHQRLDIEASAFYRRSRQSPLQ